LEALLGHIVDFVSANARWAPYLAFLFAFGTGAIKGFAVVLSLGILTSMFTALMGSRALLTLMFGGKRKITKLPIG